ncbi:Pycsar system effector family protein [Ruegeria arenilitoris]|uniref:Pycsar system effector family protein n=1 Tax=Ruegeria arenilitoris TaxID=1173585 RepID=UPI003C799123
MSQNPPNLIDIHRENLQRTIDFLKFAEAKNGAAIAFASALILATLQIREKFADLQLNELIGLCIALGAGFVAARSFLPRLSWGEAKTKGTDGEKNLLFFSDIADFSAEEFQSEFALRYGKGSDALEHDLSVQAVANSRIAVNKMHHFSISALLLVMSTALLTSSFFAELFSRF